MGKHATARRIFRQQWLEDPKLKGMNVFEKLAVHNGLKFMLLCGYNTFYVAA